MRSLCGPTSHVVEIKRSNVSGPAASAMRPGQDLDDGRDAVDLDPGHDAREPVAGGLGDDGAIRRRSSTLIAKPRDVLDLDESLAAVRPSHVQATL